MPHPTTVQWAYYTVGLIATLTLTVYLARLSRRALEEKFGPAGHKQRR